MRRTPWLAVWFVVIVGTVLMGCNGPNRSQSVSSASGFQVVVTASPNVVRGATAGSGESAGGCANVTVKVFTVDGQLVDGATVDLTTTLCCFAGPTQVNIVGITTRTTLGLATVTFCGKSERGTTTITATVEDAVATTLITVV